MNNSDYNLFASDQDLQEMAKEKAAAFIREETQFHLGFLPTEQAHPYTLDLSDVIQSDTRAGLRLMLDVDRDIPSVARRVFLSGSFAELCLAFEKAARDNRRVCFTGCGSTGRLSMILEEMWRQFWEDRAGVSPGDTVRLKDADGNLKDENLIKADLGCSIMTGGDRALIRAVENFEDYEAFGARQVEELDLQQGDLLVAITEGGETSSVLGTLREAQRRGCKVFLTFNNPASLLKENLERCRSAIESDDVTVLDLYTGAMALTGSTRMQATTMEMLVIGTAMEIGLNRCLTAKPSIQINTQIALKNADLFSLLIKDLCGPESLLGMAHWAEEEMCLYKADGRITYLAEEYLLDIFSDTTERSPTFMLPPFRPSDDTESPVSWAFAKDPAHNSSEAWIHMLRRLPRGLNWTRQDYIRMGAPEYAGEVVPSLDRDEINRYLIGREKDTSRTDCAESLFLRVFVDSYPGTVKSGEKNLVVGTITKTAGSVQADYEVPLNLAESPVNLWQHLAVKLIFNTVSTGSMAMMGRVKQNWMIQVDTTNKKLVDRGCRIISQIVGIPYEEACRELHLSLLARERFVSQGGQTILSPVVAALQRRGMM
ncbi:sugar phosphate isomerase [Oceanispirochaeta crateris]|uniref:Sugar phosphate isomerase n=1 Tax=Oceanispirochaeta crateris TaxID=2518645 RepID=A0A5C1QHB7_9SPIO|nr:sugar phosphate isomerase [Oceanispirochaeta crateris]QEN06961.1 sugar phosphate isomerase [Oceanispirochaeta crateris]